MLGAAFYTSVSIIAFDSRVLALAHLLSNLTCAVDLLNLELLSITKFAGRACLN